MNLFNFGEIVLSSGKKSNFKIDCDALTDEDIVNLAKVLTFTAETSFFDVVSIPTGGDRFANALKNRLTLDPDSEHILLVDDVLTTGSSMKKARDELQEKYPEKNIIGLVIFSRTFNLDIWQAAIFYTDTMI